MKYVKLIECLSTWQGEGPDTGKQMVLLRFRRCNKRCTYCDTVDKIDNLEEMKFSLEFIQSMVDQKNAGLMITGGEPLFSHNFGNTILLVNEIKTNCINVETNGYGLLNFLNEVKDFDCVKCMYSPKIFTFKDLKEELNKSECVCDDKKLYIKLVYQDNSYIRTYMKKISELNMNQRVYIMPEGKTRNELLENSKKAYTLADKYNFNITSRMHIIYDFV